MFQKCPICEGSGVTYHPYSNNTSDPCKTCNGKGIISQITGLPPNKQIGKNFRDFANIDDYTEQFKDK